MPQQKSTASRPINTEWAVMQKFVLTDISSLRQVATPCIDDHQLKLDEMTSKGILPPVAAKIVLKALYLARVGRMDLVWSDNVLAREVTRWTTACDRRLHRLISYIHHVLQKFRDVFFLEVLGAAGSATHTHTHTLLGHPKTDKKILKSVRNQ